jgi:RNA polymerase sigma-70 factor (ECF subfamily)
LKPENPHWRKPLSLDLRENSQAAFSELFERNKNLVYRTAFLMYGNRDDADEILQDVFMQVYRSIGSYDSQKGAITTWLHRITINTCLIRRRKKQISFEPLVDEQLAEPGDSMERGLQLSMEQQEIRKVIMDLTEKLRVVIILRYYWDLSYQEIADVLSIPLGTVKSRIDLALKTLHSKLDAFEPDKQQRTSDLWESDL